MIVSDNLGFDDVDGLGKGPRHNQVKLGVNVKPHRKVHQRTAYQKESAYWTPQNRAKFGHRAGNPATVAAYGQAVVSAPVGGGAPVITFPSNTIQGLGYLGKARKSGPVAPPAPAAIPVPPPPPPGLPIDDSGMPAAMGPAGPSTAPTGAPMMPGNAGAPKGVFAVGAEQKSNLPLVISLSAVGLLGLGAAAYFFLRKKPSTSGLGAIAKKVPGSFLGAGGMLGVGLYMLLRGSREVGK
jgi:hypothetical protein